MVDFPGFSKISEELFAMFGDIDSTRLDPSCAVYTNRSLDLSEISLVGFDMDYTLATYKKSTMEPLQYKMTIERLIVNYNYPPDICKLSYDPKLTIRGLVVDKRRGHLLKMDNHGRVWRAMHGRRQLLPKEIDGIYLNKKIRVGTSRFSSLDTLFAIPEACLYCNLVDYFEGRLAQGENVFPLEHSSRGTARKKTLDTSKLFDDVRASIDAIHYDGSLKSVITHDLSKYILADPDIALILHKFRSARKKVFLLTNSEWDYTNAVMTYLLAKQLPEYSDWRSYFDIIVTESSKPDFFTQRRLFSRLDTKTGEILQIEGISTFEKNQVYQWGNIADFEKMSGCRGEQILYIGDHIYGDIVRSKKESLWRTCLVIEELFHEIQNSILWSQDIDKSLGLDAKRLTVDGLMGQRRSLLAHIEAAIQGNTTWKPPPRSRDKLKKASKIIRREIDQAKKFLRELDLKVWNFHDGLERRFHPYWGRLFREHDELSRFGAQVTSYACIYTSRLTNLLQYSPEHYFRAIGGSMSHERTLQKRSHNKD